MAQKQFPVITRFLAVSLALIITIDSVACGWGDDYETMRLAFFKATTQGMDKFLPLAYTEHYFNEYEKKDTSDRHKNCAEWNICLGNDIDEKDIYTIQYETNPEVFQEAYVAGNLRETFKNNSFIDRLLKPDNKDFLEYFAFAKKMEYEGNPHDSKWETWHDKVPERYRYNTNDTLGVNENSLSHIEKRLQLCDNSFLQQRYAFMLIRYGKRENVISLYEKYFAAPEVRTIVKSWALLFRAFMTEDKAEQNYYLSRVLDQCNEKTLVVMQRYNHTEHDHTMEFAKNDHERAVILAIRAMRNPGPAFKDIKEINELDPGSDYVNMLVSREVNKFEDWLFYAKVSDYSPTYQNYSDEYVMTRLENYHKDMAYLRGFKKYLIKIYDIKNKHSRDFLASAIAHLSFIDDKIDDGYKYASAISENAPPSILVQKNIELALVALKQGNIENEKIKQKLYDSLKEIHRLAVVDKSYTKSLHTLFKVLAAEYHKRGDLATASLLFNKGENFKYTLDGYGYNDDNSYNYFYIGYLDKYANISDADAILSIIDKVDKTPFEKFICEGTTSGREYYLDFKGKLAFRKNNFKLAYESFAEIPDSLALKLLPYSDYVGSDSINPFYPSILNYAKPLSVHKVSFSKKNFVKELIVLNNKKDADSYMKLGHAYFNTSYLGNVWFMSAYYQGHLGWSETFGVLTENKKQYNAGNYTNLLLAKQYYQKAYTASKNDEQRALASLMLHICERNIDYTSASSNNEHKPTVWVERFYGKYNNTKAFKQYNCPSLEMYLK